MPDTVEISLAFKGRDADNNQVDFYDVAQACLGFQRSLALTTHLLLNNQIITHAPALKGASIRAAPPRPGSWEIMAIVSVGLAGLYKVGTLPKDTPLGHLIYSAYDYVVKQVVGVHVDYDKSLGQLIEETREHKRDLPQLTVERFDSLIEKCQTPIRDMHRPIIGEETATYAVIKAIVGPTPVLIGTQLNRQTYDHIAHTIRSKDSSALRGRVSGYNSNTFKGRMFLTEYDSPVPFELMQSARDKQTLQAITDSLSSNALNPRSTEIGFLNVRAHLLTSTTQTLKGIHVISATRA